MSERKIKVKKKKRKNIKRKLGNSYGDGAEGGEPVVFEDFSQFHMVAPCR